jgi:hypothetical protein
MWLQRLINVILHFLNSGFCGSEQYFCNFEAFKRVMRKFLHRKLSITFSALILILYSCTTGSCYQETNAFVKASFYNYKTQKLQAPDSVTIYGLNMEDNKLYSKAKGLQPALFPLNPATISSIFIIKINGKTDTLEFRYNSYPHLISKECGISYYHNLDTDRIFTRNAIINIYIGNGNISTVNEENIRIFY